MEFGRLVVRCRYCVLAVWVVAAALLAGPAVGLLSRLQGGFTTPPRGSESAQALAIVEHHFSDLSTIRTEKVVIECEDDCETVVTPMSKGMVELITAELMRFNNTHVGAILHIESYYTFDAHHASMIMGPNMMLSDDHKSILLQWVWRPRLIEGAAKDFIGRMQKEIVEMNKMWKGSGLHAKLTGLYTLDVMLKRTLLEQIMVHEAKTIWLPFLILAFALQSPRMLLLALMPMGIEMPVALGLMYFVSQYTVVLLYAVQMMFMLMTSLSFDYALFLLTRYAEERRHGAEVEEAIVTMISSVGRVVVTSGVVLMISWASMLGLPSLFMSFSLASGCMIIVCVLCQLTFVPAVLAVFPFLGPPKGAPGAPEPKPATGEFSPCLSSSRKVNLVPEGYQTDHAMLKARPFRTGIGYAAGSFLTAFPANVFVPLMVYVALLPLTQRFFRNFDIQQFRFIMGHQFENQVPRGIAEWSTALDVQEHFPNSMGVLMPAMIIATRDQLGADPAADPAAAGPGRALLDPLALPSLDIGGNGSTAPPGGGGATPDPTGNFTTVATTMRPVDVRQQAFFDMNCRMLNAVMAATRNSSVFQLKEDNFVSITVHGQNQDGSLACMDYWKVDFSQHNWWAQHVFLKQTSALSNLAWATMVSKSNDAMISFVFPPVDPFGNDAFQLAHLLRGVLKEETSNALVEGVEFKLFSPGTALMDLIEETMGSLPIAFLLTVAVSFLLVAVMFRAIFIPLKLVMTVLIPLTWTYGAALYVYQDGILEFLDIASLRPTGHAGLDWSVPVFTLTFLVGLALDYDVFLFERVREYRAEGFGDREAIQLGLSATGGTISSAGMIMALSFGGTTLLGSVPNTNQLGFTMVFSIMLDTFVVRTVLVPAMLSLNPCLNYYPAPMPEPRYLWLDGAAPPKAPPQDSEREMEMGFTSDFDEEDED